MRLADLRIYLGGFRFSPQSGFQCKLLTSQQKIVALLHLHCTWLFLEASETVHHFIYQMCQFPRLDTEQSKIFLGTIRELHFYLWSVLGFFDQYWGDAPSWPGWEAAVNLYLLLYFFSTYYLFPLSGTTCFLVVVYIVLAFVILCD